MATPKELHAALTHPWAEQGLIWRRPSDTEVSPEWAVAPVGEPDVEAVGAGEVHPAHGTVAHNLCQMGS